MLVQWDRWFVSVLGASGVAAAAFFAHGLQRVATPGQMRWWAIACFVQMVTTPAMLALSLSRKRSGGLNIASPGFKEAGRVAGHSWPINLMGGGVLLFSGSLYLMSLGFPRWLGAVTPLGGLLLIAGWLSVVLERR